MDESTSQVQRLIAVNVGTFVLFHTVGQGRASWIAEHFFVSLQGVLAGRPWTLLTSSIAHLDTTHLLFNLLGLWVFGPLVEARMGVRAFWAVVVGGALTSGLAHVGFEWWSSGDARALGASGVVLALATVATWLAPHRKILLFFVLPLPMFVVMPLFVAMDVWGLTDTTSEVGHAAHLGGVVFGAAWVAVWQRFGARTPRDG